MVEFSEGRLEPGEATDAHLVLAVPRFWRGVVDVGDVLEGGEGNRVVATAAVVEIMGA